MTEFHEQTTMEHPAVPLTAPVTELPGERLPEQPSASEDELRRDAAALAASWAAIHHSVASAHALPERLKSLKRRLTARLLACKAIANPRELTPQLELLESTRALEGVLQSLSAATAEFRELPHVTVAGGEAIPRVMNLAEGYLSAAAGIWSADSLSVYVRAVQVHDVLRLREVLLLPVALKLAQLEYVLDRADEVFAAGEIPPIEESPFSAPLHSLRRLNQFEWPDVLEPLVPFHSLLLQDPAGVFERMEEETRDSYRLRVAELAAHADASEMKVAETALLLARSAADPPSSDPRLARRVSHVGYYLFEQGFAELSRRIDYHPPAVDRLRALIFAHNEEFYILGIFLMSVLLIVVLIAPLVPHQAFGAVIFALFLALLPATQGAADLVNNLVTSGLHPRALPKLDFSEGIPAEETTFVVVPTLLLSERQVREMFEDLEARYLSNQDPNLHFGLLTDLPDSLARPEPEDRNELAELALSLTNDLNRKYEGQRGGSFLLLHRHRVFNARQGVWMGWERKRGKLLDLNKLHSARVRQLPGERQDRCTLLNGVAIRHHIGLGHAASARHRGAHDRNNRASAQPGDRKILDSRIVTAGLWHSPAARRRERVVFGFEVATGGTLLGRDRL